ncbi:hypothetical protein J2128_000397 [Methanomicrobium sp. W14]|uniref:hypothetical protein n=1 Tax=Methanomicrobium sp. W14 TaxID=2817839 RepID=UPI001FDA59F7|nr:hypothetical protein [Methanomicrobium sp. W14]MBP2132476.1 hypothetical protein [Methanomicrobium sp. W14]
MDISGGNGKEIIIGILLFAVILAGFACLQFVQSDKAQSSNNDTVEPTDTQVSESSNVGGWVSHNLVLNAPPSKESQDSVMVYRTLSPVVTDDITLGYAKIFNVTGILKNDVVIQSENNRYAIEISRISGSVTYSDYKRPNEKQDAPEFLPSDEEAIEIATKFLKENDLYPDGVANTVVQRENAYTVGKGDEVYFGEIGVWYRRSLNDIKVEGTQLVVYVGGGGDIIGYYANWREYEPYKEYTVITLDKAFENLKSEGVYVGKDNKDAQVYIDDAYLAYHTKAGAYTENYLEPVWVFKGNVMNEDNKLVTDVVQYVPALAEEPTKLVSA